jgi:quinol monooxygenase YgiN
MTADVGVVGVMSLRSATAEDLAPIFADDYAYLRDAYPDFISGRLVRSTSDEGLFFHITEWTSIEALAAARSDPHVGALFAQVPGHVFMDSHACLPIVDAEEGLR